MVLGIDPGTTVTGWAVIEADEGQAIELWSGFIKTESSDSGSIKIGRRLRFIKERLDQVWILHPDIDIVAYEGGFVGQHPQANMAIGYARGLAMLSAAEHDRPHVEYAPATVKKTIANHGQASKQALAFSIASRFHFVDSIQEDEADAIGIALTHLIKVGECW